MSPTFIRHPLADAEVTAATGPDLTVNEAREEHSLTPTLSQREREQARCLSRDEDSTQRTRGKNRGCADVPPMDRMDTLTELPTVNEDSGASGGLLMPAIKGVLRRLRVGIHREEAPA